MPNGKAQVKAPVLLVINQDQYLEATREVIAHLDASEPGPANTKLKAMEVSLAGGEACPKRGPERVGGNP